MVRMRCFTRSSLLAGLLSALFCGAAPAAFSPWTIFDRTSGLVENTVQVIARDPGGGLWMGTRGGLSRFDGEQWLNLTTGDGLPDDDVRTIFFDPLGGVWLGTKRGFGLFRDGAWSRLGLPGVAEGERVSVVADGDGVIWFGYGGGLMRFDAAEGTLAAVPEMEGVAVTALLSDAEGNLWAGTRGGLRRFDGLFWKEYPGGQGPAAGPVAVLLEDSGGSIWVGTAGGLSQFDGTGWESWTKEDGLPGDGVSALAEDRLGRIWVGTDRGAGWYDGYDWIWLGRGEGIPDEKVLALSSDLNGSIWVGTAAGLVRFDTSWAHMPPLGYDGYPPRAPLLVAPDGTRYLGTEEGLLEVSGRSVDRIGARRGISGKVTRLLLDDDAGLWVGTDSGLSLYDGARAERYVPPPVRVRVRERETGGYNSERKRDYDRFYGLKGDVVTALAPDGEGGLWVGTTEGLSRFDGVKWELVEENETLYSAPVTALAADGRGGDLWVGTPSGLWRRRGGEWLRQTGPGVGDVLSLAVDREGRAWVGTGGGLSLFDGAEWRRFDRGDGLLGEKVAVIFQDRSGAMWFGTEAGVARFDGNLWSALSEADGLHANAITSITQVGEEMWFGSPGGVTVYRPDRAPPDTRIKNPPAGVVGASSCLFEFAGSDYETSPHEMRFSWRLDEGPWTPFSPRGSAALEGLANGTHAFSVRSLDKGLNADPTPATVLFQVDTGLFDLELVDAVFEDIYASLFQFYSSGASTEPAARITVRNRYDEPLRVKFSLFIPGLMDFPSDRVAVVQPGGPHEIPLGIELSEEVLSLEKTSTRQILLTMQYSLRGEPKEASFSRNVTVLEKHSMVWEEAGRVGLYVTHLDEPVGRFARGVVRQFRDEEKEAIIYGHLMRGIELFDALGALGVRYLADAKNPYGSITANRTVLDLISFPRETLEARSGDCDDVSVLYAALLQNIGIDTALVDVGDHVFVMFDTGLRSRRSWQLTRDQALLHVDGKDRVWVPVEVTLLGRSFTEAWRAGAKMLRERPFTVIETREAWKRYAPLVLPLASKPVELPTREQIRPLLDEDLKLQEQNLVSASLQGLRSRVAKDPADVEALNAMGVLLARNGYLVQADERFRRVIDLAPGFAGGHSNLANVLYEQERYEEAVESYLRALELDPGSPEVHVELALTYCETGRFDLARRHYEAAMELAPGGGVSDREENQ